MCCIYPIYILYSDCGLVGHSWHGVSLTNYHHNILSSKYSLKFYQNLILKSHRPVCQHMYQNCSIHYKFICESAMNQVKNNKCICRYSLKNLFISLLGYQIKLGRLGNMMLLIVGMSLSHNYKRLLHPPWTIVTWMEPHVQKKLFRSLLILGRYSLSYTR